ncbi:MAG: hypothetical protein J6V72_00395 [Kiritimatiellae bacterium]|nr:hypothetical protein [Kiritimatiellia bacterium]
MITEKQLLKWGFEKGIDFFPPSEVFFRLILKELPQNRYEYVEYRPKDNTLQIYHDSNFLVLSAVTTKRKADQALRLLGLPPIDKLNTIKK